MTIGFPQPRVRALLVASILVLSGLAGCGGGGKTNSDGGAKGGSGGSTSAGGTIGSGGTTTGSGGQVGVDMGASDRPTTTPLAAIGQPCKVGTDCQSTFCADGVCCNTACNGVCVTCSSTDNVGTCIPADVNTDPRSDCTDEGSSTCGKNGNCDGTGACQLYVAGVACGMAGCTNTTLTFAGRCDGLGSCNAPTSQSCSPYICGTTGSCKTTCSADADCTGSGNFCVNGSCGPKPPGATCAADGDCKSGHCANSVCCATTCTGNCMSCAITGSAGTCINVPAGQDPLAQCADQLAPSCKTNGSCDGKGGCQLYASGTVCGTNSCTAGEATAAGKCDGTGTCQAGTMSSCNAYVCDTTGVCKTTCTVDTDCSTGNFCIGGSCGKKVPGTTCTADSDCGTGHCAQGVCCNNACTGTCMSCDIAGTIGTCSPIPAGTDPLVQCNDLGATNQCGTNGFCDGAGACQFYPAGTNCAPPSCSGSTLTSARTCDGAGSCRAATTSMCDPFQCGGTACKTTCMTSTDCVAPNSCVNNSCGKLPPGATCTAASACQSGFCAQGVCCNNACAGACMSCALTNSAGTCSPVPAGAAPTPATQCTMAAASTCGLDGTCNGTGACRSYPSGTQCAAAICSVSTLTPAQTCDGAGTCKPVTAAACPGNLNCGSATACKTSCSTAADCVSPDVCTTGACALKTPGTTCGSAAECASGFCQQGVCCNSACTGICQSCNNGGSAGTCTNVPANTAPTPTTQCATATVATCGTDGLCDGSGKCQLYPSTTTCVPQSCTGDTLTPARNCDGAGNCKTVTSTLCDPFACDTTNNVCKTTCTVSTDCTAPSTCMGNPLTCGKLPIGATCTMSNACASGFCVNTVCCNNACTGICTVCNQTGSVGTCTSVMGGTAPTPTTQCATQATSTCGTNGLCNGSGACQKYPSGTTCGGATCTGSSLTGASTCNSSNVCTAPAATSCTPYICGTNACKTTCASTADCLSPDVCLSSACVPPVKLTVQLAERDLNATDPAVAPHLEITNTSTTTAITLSTITLRYWYIQEGTDGVTETTSLLPQTAHCDYAALGCGNITTSFAFVSPAVTGANAYFQVGFTTGAGSLAPNNANTNEIQLYFTKNDFSNFSETNDYSYVASTSYATTMKVTAYYNGALVYGTEP
jgi:hypothetical protein